MHCPKVHVFRPADLKCAVAASPYGPAPIMATSQFDIFMVHCLSYKCGSRELRSAARIFSHHATAVATRKCWLLSSRPWPKSPDCNYTQETCRRALMQRQCQFRNDRTYFVWLLALAVSPLKTQDITRVLSGHDGIADVNDNSHLIVECHSQWQ